VSLRERLRSDGPRRAERDLYGQYGLLSNPFPPSSQTAGHPHHRSPSDDEIEARITDFINEHRSQVVVVEGTQGVGKTNLLNFWETEIEEALGDSDGYYVIRYLADPEASFDGTLRRLFQELGVDHIKKLAERLSENGDSVNVARNPEMKSALRRLAADPNNENRIALFQDWLLGLRVLKAHREELNPSFPHRFTSTD
jgi:hypothetical protein